MSSDERRTNHRNDLFELIGELARRRYQLAERSYAALGLNHTEGRLLKMLDTQGGTATQDALSRQILVDRSNAGRAFKALEHAGYITRRKDEADSRTNVIDITAEGRKAAADVKRLGDEIAGAFFGDLTEAEAESALALLRRAL